MKASIKNWIAINPSGLLELKSALTISEYRENYGFGLQENFTIYQSERISSSRKEWFAFPRKTLKTLFTVQKESEGNLLVVYIVETIKSGKVYCHMILSNEAYQEMLNDNTCHILQVHQMYSKFWQDHVSLNLAKY
jgi:hypothetical protein